MVDVRVDYTALGASRAAFQNMKSLLEGSTASLDDVSASAIPQEDLRGRLSELHDSWGGGLNKLSRFAEDAATGLTGILEAFQSLDSELAASMESEAADA